MTNNHYAPPGAHLDDQPVPKESRLAWASLPFAASSVAAVVVAESFLLHRFDLHPYTYVMNAAVALLVFSVAFGIAAFVQWRGSGTRSTALQKWVFIQTALALLVLTALLLAFIFAPPLQ